MPKVLISGGRYINSYPPVYQSFGCETEMMEAADFQSADLSRYDLIHIDNWKNMPSEVQDKLYDFARDGKYVIFSLGSVPDRRFFNTAEAPQYVEGWGGDIVPAPGAENFFRTVKGPCGYTSWAGIIHAAHLPNVTVLANWTMPQNTSKVKMMIDAFKTTAPAILRIQVGKGAAFYAGALLTKPSCSGLLRGIVNTLFPQTDLLSELEAQLETEAEPANKTDLLKSNAVAVFREPGFPRSELPGDVTPEFIADALRRHGLETVFLNTAELLEKLDTDNFNTIVLSYGETFPLAAYGKLRRFAAAGGGIVSPAGLPLSRPLIREADGAYRELADGERTEQIMTLVADKLLPIGKYFYEQTASASCAILSEELLPGFPTVIPGRGKVGLQLLTAGSYRSQSPLVAALNPAGEVESIPLAFQFYQNRFPAARFVLATFGETDHPWSPASWNRAADFIAATVKLALKRDYASVTDLYVDKVFAAPGETVAIHGATRGMRTLLFKVKISVYPYHADRPVLEKTVPVKLSAPGVGRFKVDFTLPEGKDADRYDILAEIIHPQSTPVNVQRTMLLVNNGKAPANRAVIQFADGHFTVNGRPARLNGANLYVNEGRAPGAFFLGEKNPQKLADVWERDLDLIKLTGGNASRQHYFEKVLDETSFADDDNLQIRALDAYLKLHDLTDSISVIAPLTFAPVNYENWKKRFPAAVQYPYVEKEAVRATMDYLRNFSLRYAPFRNIAWEIINEPELHTPTASSRQSEQDIRNWMQEAVFALKAGGADQPIGIGNTHNYDSVQFNLRENLKGVVFWSNIHPYYQDAMQLRCLKSTPFGLNFGRACLVGEIGMPNPHSSPSAKLGDWQLYYENTFAAMLAEQSAGFFNFYLSNSLNTGAPEWGILRGDLTEKAEFKRWKLWTALSELLPPDQYLREPNLLVYFLDDRRTGRNNHSSALSVTYLDLVHRGANAKILSEEDLEDPIRAGFVWLAATPQSQKQAEKLAGRLKRQNIPSEIVAVGDKADIIPPPPDCELPVNDFTLSYAVRKKDGGRTFVLIDARGTAAELKFKRSYAISPAPGTSVIIDTLPDGSPRLIQLTGGMEVDGRPLADSPIPFLLAAPAGQSLLAENTTADLYADRQSAVKTGVPLRNRLPEAAAYALPADLAPELRDAFQAAGGRIAPPEQADFTVRFQAENFTRQNRWPEVRLGRHRLERPWSAAIEFTGREVVITAPTPVAKLAALLRLADLRQSGRYSVGPFYRQEQ